MLWHVGLQNFLCLELLRLTRPHWYSQIVLWIILITLYIYLGSRRLKSVVKERLQVFKLLIWHLCQGFWVAQGILLVLCPIVLQSSQVTLQVNHSILLLRGMAGRARWQSFVSIFEHLIAPALSIHLRFLFTLIFINCGFKISIHTPVHYGTVVKHYWACSFSFSLGRCYYYWRCSYRLIFKVACISTRSKRWSSIHSSLL